MRGRPEGDMTLSGRPGNTPAHAGKTLVVIVLHQLAQKHPRACGEDEKLSLTT